MKMIKKVPTAEELRENMSLSDSEKDRRRKIVNELRDILSGKTTKKIILVGPCSADNESAVLDYMTRLAKINDRIQDHFLVIPRVYTSKPRTTGSGYKGLLHRPDAVIEDDDIYTGIIATRRMHLKIIQETGFFCADEMLYPEAFYYICDLLAYAAVGARSVEDQQHRMVASGLDVPVGMKNPTGGDIDVMINAIKAAQAKQTLLYHGWECQTEGNSYAHGVLRGYRDLTGKPQANYHYETLCDIHDIFVKSGLLNPSVIIDCNHDNSRKNYDAQYRIAKEVFYNSRIDGSLDQFVKGIMIESYIDDGSQMIGEGIYGKSITDPCLGWEKTERLLLELGDMV